MGQWFSVTTPAYKNGTIARPLPETKVPAFVKNQAISPKIFQSNYPKPMPGSMKPDAAGFLAHFGGGFTII
jgi:hypothetical protein